MSYHSNSSNGGSSKGASTSKGSMQTSISNPAASQKQAAPALPISQPANSQTSRYGIPDFQAPLPQRASTESTVILYTPAFDGISLTTQFPAAVTYTGNLIAPLVVLPLFPIPTTVDTPPLIDTQGYDRDMPVETQYGYDRPTFGAPFGRANGGNGIQNRLPEIEEPAPIGNPQNVGPQHGLGISDTISSTLENDIESNRFVSAYNKLQNLIRPVIDFRDPSTFACYGSAEQYYKDAFYRIRELYPYDGSRAERLEWLLSASTLDVSILRHVYPKATGHVNFSLSGTGSVTSHSEFYCLTSRPEYIQFD